MIKKLIVIVLILSPQKSSTFFTTETPQVVRPPLALPVISNLTDEPIDVFITYLYKRRINNLLPFGGRAQTTVDEIPGATIALEIQTMQNSSVPIPVAFPSGRQTYTQDHLAGLQVTAHSTSQRKLAIAQLTGSDGIPTLQVQPRS